jgi:hypothetical protein
LRLGKLGQQPGLDPLLSLLTLPVRPKAEIPIATIPAKDLRHARAA